NCANEIVATSASPALMRKPRHSSLLAGVNAFATLLRMDLPMRQKGRQIVIGDQSPKGFRVSGDGSFGVIFDRLTITLRCPATADSRPLALMSTRPNLGRALISPRCRLTP